MSQHGARDHRAPISVCLPGEAMPRPPQIDVQVVADVSRTASEGFLQLREVELRNMYRGAASEPYRYFLVERASMDAVAVVLFRRSRVASGELEIVLRSQLRPPLCFRSEYDLPLPAMGTGAVQWEIPAGLVEPGERGEAGLFARASAEALEEVGVQLAPARFFVFGPATSLSPGLIAEKVHFLCAEILDHDTWQEPEGDGHAVEEHSRSVFVPLSNALAALESGTVHDVKTEVGIHRLAAFARTLAPQDPSAP